MTNTELIRYWNAFGDVPINDNDQIMIPFMGFLPGTDRFEIWHWFDEHYSKGVALLMKDCEVFNRLDETGYWHGYYNKVAIKIQTDSMSGPFFVYIRQETQFFWHKLTQLNTFDDVSDWFSKNLREVVEGVSSRTN